MPSPTLTRRALLTGAGTITASAALAVPFIDATHSGEFARVPGEPALADRARMVAAVVELRAAMHEVYGVWPQISNQLLTRGGIVSMGCLPDPTDHLCWYVSEVDTPDNHPLRLSHRASKRASYGVPARVVAARHHSA